MKGPTRGFIYRTHRSQPESNYFHPQLTEIKAAAQHLLPVPAPGCQTIKPGAHLCHRISHAPHRQPSGSFGKTANRHQPINNSYEYSRLHFKNFWHKLKFLNALQLHRPNYYDQPCSKHYWGRRSYRPCLTLRELKRSEAVRQGEQPT